MTFDEATKIYDNWRRWFYPVHIILFAIFSSKIPESFLPYPQDILEEALNIIAKHYYDIGDYKISKDIQGTMSCLIMYVKDEGAFKSAVELFNWRSKEPKMKELFFSQIEKLKKDWTEWAEKTTQEIKINK